MIRPSVRLFYAVGAFLVALFVLPVSLHAQQAAQFLTGRILDRETKEPVPLVSVYDKTHHNGTAADGEGKFELWTNVGDSLVLTSIGYENTLYIVNAVGGPVTIEIKSMTYQLDQVTVHAFPDYSEFKRLVAKTEVSPQKPAFELYIPKGYHIPDERGAPGAEGSVGVGVSIRGPISALYNALSKEGKEKRRLEELHKTQDHDALVDEKYNAEMVQRVTQLDVEDAKKFMEWCKLDDDFILKSTDYDLAVAMLNCLESFKQQREAEQE